MRLTTLIFRLKFTKQLFCGKNAQILELAMWLVFSLLHLSVKKRQIDAKKSIDRFFQKGLRFFYAVPLFENLQAVF